MKKILIGVLAFIIAITGMMCIETIGAGKVGVVYSASSGVKDETLDQGWHIMSPFEKVYEFSIANEQLVLSKDAREGSKDDESFKVATSDNANISISFQMSYRFIPDKVTGVFNNFRGMDGERIVDERIRTVLKSEISEITSDYTMMEIYSGNRAEINEKLYKHLEKRFVEKYGIEVTDASIIDVHPDKDLEQSIKAKVAAMQRKEQAKAEQETAKVEAETNLIEAENAAKIKITNAEATAKANKILQESLSDKTLQKMFIEKWDGELPKVSGSEGNMFDISSLLE